MVEAPSLTLHVLTGGSGRTCQHVVRACLAQFQGVYANVVLRPRVESVPAVELEVEEAARAGALYRCIVLNLSSAAGPGHSSASPSSLSGVSTVFR